MNVRRTRSPEIVSIVGIVMLSGLLAAASGAAESPLGPPIDTESEAREFDWMQISSGEWVKGVFDRLHDEKVYFDSSEFDDVTIDWADVVSLLPVKPVTLRLMGQETVMGTLVMRDRKIQLATEGGVREFEPNEIMGIITGTGREIEYWSGKASVGLSARAGNTEQMDINIRGDLRRQTALTRFTTSYIGQISSGAKSATANSHRVPANFDVFLTDRLFITTPAFEYFTDEFQNIGSRITTGAALGYELIENSRVLWEIGAGAAYQYTSFNSVAMGSPTANDAAIVASTKVEFDLPRGIEWDNSYKVQIVATDIGKTNHHAESILSFDIWGPVELDMTFIFDRVEQPVANAAGEVPLSNDYRLTMGLGLDF